MRQHENILKFGLRDDIEYHISEVESGLRCNCICPACGEQLVAKKGEKEKPQEHFAHKNKIQCEYAYETSIHYESKRILEKKKRITLPFREFFFDTLNLNNFYFKDINESKIGTLIPKTYEIENVLIEKKLHDIVPDIKCTINSKPILIEIAVTSKIKLEKQEKIRNIGIPVIEIDLSKMDRDSKTSLLELNLIENINNKTWYSNPKDENIIQKLLYKHKKILEEISGLIDNKRIVGFKNNPLVKDCPLIISSLKSKNVELYKCQKCRFNIATHEFIIMCVYKKYQTVKNIIDEINKTSP